MANGRVCTGFSMPFVAVYNNNEGTITFTDGMSLARGVEVSIEPEGGSSDNVFYADNQAAESDAGVFTGGTLTLTVDGLKSAAEKLIFGLPAVNGDGFVEWGDSMNVPYVGIGFVARYMSDGVTTYDAIILPKTKMNPPTSSHATSEDQLNFQTQELTGTILRADDSNHNWKITKEELATETLAINAIKNYLNIAVVATYTVTFNSNGGSDVASQTVTAGSTATQPEAPTKTGYTFDGWYADAELTTLFDFTDAINVDTTVYAKWAE